jgi:hypothetical protein
VVLVPELAGIELWRWVAGLFGIVSLVLIWAPSWIAGELVSHDRWTWGRGVQPDPPVWRWRRSRRLLLLLAMGAGWGLTMAAISANPLFIPMGLVGFGPSMYWSLARRPRGEGRHEPPTPVAGTVWGAEGE